MKPVPAHAAIAMTALAIALLAAAAGCRSGGVASPGVTQGDPPIAISWKPQNDQPQDPQSPITKEIEKQLNVKLNYVYMDRTNEPELLNLRISTGDIPDVMVLQSPQYSAYSHQGVLAAIPEEMIRIFAPTYYKLTKQNGGYDIFDYYKVDGKLYGLPFIQPNDYNFIPVWRDDWLRNVGIDRIPQTLREAEEAFYRFARNDPDRNGKMDTYALSDRGMYAVFGAFGAHAPNPLTWSVKDGAVVASPVLPEMKDALKLLAKWYRDGLIDPSFITGENKGQYYGNAVTFRNGTIGFSVPGVYYHVYPKLDPDDPNDLGSVLYQNFKRVLGDGASYAPGTPLLGPTGKRLIYKWSTQTGAALTMGRDVADNAAKMQKILTIVEKFSADEAFFKLVWFGIEGVSYETDPRTQLPSWLGPYKELPYRGTMALGPNAVGWPTNNFDFYRKYTITPKQMEFVKRYETQREEINAVWAPLPSDGRYKAQLEKKFREWYALFITGQMNVDRDWGAFLDDANRSGLPELTAEANDWYRTYKRESPG